MTQIKIMQKKSQTTKIVIMLIVMLVVLIVILAIIFRLKIVDIAKNLLIPS